MEIRKASAWMQPTWLGRLADGLRMLVRMRNALAGLLAGTRRRFYE
jgi:hypothetical protein